MHSRAHIVSTLTAVVAVLVSVPVLGATSPQTVNQICPRLASGALGAATMSVLPAGTLVRSGTMKITQKDLDAEIAKAPTELRAQLKANSFFLLENKFTSALVVAQAQAWGKKNGRKADETQPQLLQAYFTDLTSTIAVTDAETQTFYDGNKDMVGGASFEQVKAQLKEYLIAQKRQAAVDAHIDDLAAKAEAQVDSAWVRKQYASAMNNPVEKARSSGKPSMVDFGADGCGPCDMMTPIIESLKTEYAGKVNVLFVHVRKEQILAARYGIQSIPVQAFYDEAGKEVYRHVGFFSKDQILAKLAEMGVK